MSGRAFFVFTLRFLLELGAIVALCWAAVHAPFAWPLRIVGVVAAPLAVALVWGSAVAPRAPWRVPGWARLVPELAVFGGAALALVFTGYARIGWSYGAVALIDTIAAHLLDEEQTRERGEG
jgi:hypothetical protein